MADATRWRAPPADALRLVVLDDLTAIYHRPSGITHLVVSPVPELVEALADSWYDIAAVEARFDLIDGDREALIAKLEELVAAGLMEAA